MRLMRGMTLSTLTASCFPYTEAALVQAAAIVPLCQCPKIAGAVLPCEDAIVPVPWDRWDRAFPSGSGAPKGSGVSATAAQQHLKKQQLGAQYGAFLAGVDTFDPVPFGLSPQEVMAMDPQHRMLLESAGQLLSPHSPNAPSPARIHLPTTAGWSLLLHAQETRRGKQVAGRRSSSYRALVLLLCCHLRVCAIAWSSGKAHEVGKLDTNFQLGPACNAATMYAVYVGISWSEYHNICVSHGANTGPYAAQGAVLSVAPGRISYTFGLQVTSKEPIALPWDHYLHSQTYAFVVGASLAVDTACSASLVATHLAAKALAGPGGLSNQGANAGKARGALAAGANTMVSASTFVAANVGSWGGCWQGSYCPGSWYQCSVEC
eukprot:1154291-Pelagomonas_calceolata.AAC.15